MPEPEGFGGPEAPVDVPVEVEVEVELGVEVVVVVGIETIPVDPVDPVVPVDPVPVVTVPAETVPEPAGAHDSVTPRTGSFTGNEIDDRGVPAGTFTVNESFPPPSTVTVTTHESA